jgi:hypothetical protein
MSGDTQPQLPSTEDGRTKLEALRVQHPGYKIHWVEDPDEFGLVIFRRPGKLDLRSFKADRADDDLAPLADERLAAKLVLHPDAAGFSSLLDQYPALAPNIAGQGVKLAGGGKLDVKKA